MQTVKTEISINAPIEDVWNKLIDFKSYPNWNPFMTNIQGKFGLNEILKVTLLTENKKSMMFKPRIVLTNQYEFHWLGKFIISGLFDGRHSFRLSSVSNHSVKFEHYEVFSGVLHKPFLKIIHESTLLGFEKMNSAFKQYCES